MQEPNWWMLMRIYERDVHYVPSWSGPTCMYMQSTKRAEYKQRNMASGLLFCRSRFANCMATSSLFLRSHSAVRPQRGVEATGGEDGAGRIEYSCRRWGDWPFHATRECEDISKWELNLSSKSPFFFSQGDTKAKRNLGNTKRPKSDLFSTSEKVKNSHPHSDFKET